MIVSDSVGTNLLDVPPFVMTVVPALQCILPLTLTFPFPPSHPPPTRTNSQITLSTVSRQHNRARAIVLS